jgi:hypothetical protein
MVCSSAHFIITTDDHVYVNINGLFRTLLIHDSSLKTSVAGICEMGSLRDTALNYMVSILCLPHERNLRYLPVYSLVFSHRILYIHLPNGCMVYWHHPKSVLGHHVSLQQMKVVWNTLCDNGLTRMQLMFNIIMTAIPKFTVFFSICICFC